MLGRHFKSLPRPKAASLRFPVFLTPVNLLSGNYEGFLTYVIFNLKKLHSVTDLVDLTEGFAGVAIRN